MGLLDLWKSKKTELEHSNVELDENDNAWDEFDLDESKCVASVDVHDDSGVEHLSAADRLVQGCRMGDLARVEAAISDGANVNELAARNRTGKDASESEVSPVWVAIKHGHYDVVVWLLSHGADPGARIYPCVSTPAIMQLLVDVGADLNEPDFKDVRRPGRYLTWARKCYRHNVLTWAQSRHRENSMFLDMLLVEPSLDLASVTLPSHLFASSDYLRSSLWIEVSLHSSS